MSISFDKALGIHEQALGFRAQRAEVLANNIANADTPNYKARDLDFASVLAAQNDKNQNGTFALNKTNTRHIEAQGLSSGDESAERLSQVSVHRCNMPGRPWAPTVCQGRDERVTVRVRGQGVRRFIEVG